MHVVLGDSDEATTGNITLYNADDHATTAESGGKDASGAISFRVGATRSIHIESVIVAGNGKETKVVFVSQSNSRPSTLITNETLETRSSLLERANI